MNAQTKNTKLVIAVVIIVGLILAFILRSNNQVSTTISQTSGQPDTFLGIPNSQLAQAVTIDDQQLSINEVGGSSLEPVSVFETTLIDVTGGDALGIAQAGIDESGLYNLLVVFDNLPELQPNQQYAGWLVNKKANSIIFTGQLAKETGDWSNIFFSKTDHTDADFYAITIQTDNNISTPETVILEGAFFENPAA